MRRRLARRAAAQALAQGHDVGAHAAVLPAPQRAGAAHAGLHLVEDEENALGVADLAQADQTLLGNGPDAALALDWLDQDRGGALGDRLP